MSNHKSSCWAPEDAVHLKDFERRRNLTLRATRKLFEKFHAAHFKGNPDVLEIGAGLGFLRRNWPEKYKGKWIETDEQPEFLKGRENTRPASVYNLPFEKNSFDMVCGFSSFDVLRDLKAAFIEVHRVLRPGGLFFSMIDMLPNSIVTKRWQERTGLQISEDGIIVGDTIHNPSESYLPAEKEEKFNRLVERNPEDFDRLWARYSLRLDTHYIFRQDIVEAMKGFFPKGSISSGTLRSFFRGPLTEVQRAHRNCFAFINDAFFNGLALRTMMGYPIERFRVSKNLLELAKTFAPGPLARAWQVSFHEWASLLSKNLAERIEPECTEFSQVHYVLARKS